MNGPYLDAAYVAKCYLNEPDSAAVRIFAQSSETLHTSAFSIAEVACVFHRHVREGSLKPDLAVRLRDLFLDDIRTEVFYEPAG